MHEPLTEPLKLCLTRLSGCHHREILIHAAVPAAEAVRFRAGVKVLDIEALAGRADEGAGAAAQALIRELLPEIGLEHFKLSVAVVGRFKS